jgi:large subunit ribosomal protein L25
VSSAQVVLKASRRTETGKAVAHLRKAGLVPAVVFGHGLESIPVSLDAHEFEHLRKIVHTNTIISLDIEGKDTQRVLIHGYQIDPRTRHLLHVDLFALKSGEEVTVDVPLHTVGEAFAAARLGGTLLHTVDHVRVRALPEKLPQALEVSVEPLVDFDTTVHLRDVVLPPGVTLLADLDEVVAKVAAPHVVEEVAPAAAAEEEAAEAPEAAEATAAAEAAES